MSPPPFSLYMSPLSKNCILFWPPEFPLLSSKTKSMDATGPRQLLQQQGKTVEQLFHSLAENQANTMWSMMPPKNSPKSKFACLFCVFFPSCFYCKGGIFTQQIIVRVFFWQAPPNVVLVRSKSLCHVPHRWCDGKLFAPSSRAYR